MHSRHARLVYTMGEFHDSCLSVRSIARVQHDLEELRLRCGQLESSLATSEAELQRLREVNQRVQRRVHETVSVL